MFGLQFKNCKSLEFGPKVSKDFMRKLYVYNCTPNIPTVGIVTEPYLRQGEEGDSPRLQKISTKFGPKFF